MSSDVKRAVRLKAKKASLLHGQWLPWLEANADVLGFEHRTTASRLMRFANDALTHHLHPTESQRAMVAASIANIQNGGDRRSDQSANLQTDVPQVSRAAAAEMLNVSEHCP